jgi:cell division protein FtsL
LNTSVIIPIIAVAVSLVSIGLLFANNLNFQSEIIHLNNNITGQSQTIKDLDNKLDLNKQTLVQLQANHTILNEQINLLNNRISSLEQQVVSLDQQVGSLESNQQQLVHPDIQCNNSQGVVQFCNSIGGQGVTENRIYKKLPSTLPNDYWTAEFEYKFTSSSIPNHYILALTGTSDDPTSQSQTQVLYILHGKELDQLLLPDTNGYSKAIPIQVNTQYYVKLDRTPTQLILSVFSDPARKTQIQGSPITANISANEYSNLNFIQHADSKLAGSARILTAELDNTIIYNSSNPSQVLFQDDYSSTNGWTQVGASVYITKIINTITGETNPRLQNP